MRKFLIFLLIPFLIASASVSQKGQNPYRELLKVFEKTFTFHKKAVNNGTIVYTGVELKRDLVLLKAKDVAFYTGTPLLVGEADGLTYINIAFKAKYTAKRIKFAADKNKIFSIVENTELTDGVNKLFFPQIVNILIWQPNRFFYQSQGTVLYKNDTQQAQDCVYLQSEVRYHPQTEKVVLNLTAKDDLFLKFEGSLKVSNVKPDLLKVLKSLKNNGGNVNLDKKSQELILNIVPEELEMSIKLHPYALKILKSDKKLKNEIENLEEELKNLPKNSLEAKVLKAMLNLLHGKSDTAVVKIVNKDGLTLEQISILLTAASMAKTDEQAIQLIEPYFDIKIVDY